MQSQPHIRQALQRAREALERRPAAALGQDMVARAVWQGGLSTALPHPTLPGARTAMPAVLGGEGDAPVPGWFFRAGIASCLATSIAMEASLRGIELARLEVEAHSESDARGLLGTPGVPAEPLSYRVTVTLDAAGLTDSALRDLVATAEARSPMSGAIRRAAEIAVDVHVVSAQAA